MSLDTSVIPKGMFCYTSLGDFIDGEIPVKLCSFWSRDKTKPEQESGYCELLKKGDWMENGTWLLWDQVKACDINAEWEDEFKI